MTSQRFAAMLFTDIVGSTERAAELRDTAWRELRRRHDALVRTELRRFGGREVNTAGDSFLATFDEPEQAIRCAAAIRDGVRALGLELRSGVHMGKVEGEGRDAGGLAFHVVARVAAEAEPGEILVTGAVREALAGSSIDFEDRDARVLKGLPGEWHLYRVASEPAVLAAAPSGSSTRQARRMRSPFSVPRPRVPRAFAALLVGFLIGLGILFGWLRTHPEADAGGRKVLAVLPFENLGVPEDEYFADGMTDEVRGKLSALPGLEVIATQSSAEYKKSTKSLAQIGRELGADYLVVGKVRWEQGTGGQSRVRVSPELVYVGSGRRPSTKWQAPFDAALTDVFQVQADIAARVAGELDVALGTNQRQALAAKPTANLAAYDAYLRGEEATQGLSSADAASLRRGIDFYEQAVALDSTFAPAWARLARAHAIYYFNGTPTSAGAAQAKAAAERAIALAPERPESQLALGDFHAIVRNDAAQALDVYKAALERTPSDSDLLAAAAFVEQSLGRWEAALEHFTRAHALDPRSVQTARRLARTLLWLRRYPEAAAAHDRALALAPGDVPIIQGQAMVRLAQGDLDGARAVLRSAAQGVEPVAFVTYMANFWDLGWVLDDAQQRLLLEIGPEPYDNRGTWAIVLAQAHALRGDQERARSYADTARVATEKSLRDAPDDAQRHVFLGLMLAYLGRKVDAVREGERAVALTPISKDAFSGPYFQHQLARIYILVGEHEKALDRLEPLLKIPYYLSPGWLKVDPNLDPLRSNPRFQRLVGAS